MTRRRPLTKGELDLWKRATADVRPLADLPADDRPEPRAKTKPAKAAVGLKTAGKAAAPKPKSPGSAAPRPLDARGPIDIDRRNWERLKRGQLTIDKKLDLHGRTQVEAHVALDRFLSMASAAGLRCVLVVTGKGGVDGRGILRQMVPRWLGEAGNREMVLTYSPAQPRHGGDGALYVLLKRRRNHPRR